MRVIFKQLRVVPKYFKLKAKAMTLPRALVYSNDAKHHSIDLYKIEKRKAKERRITNE